MIDDTNIMLTIGIIYLFFNNFVRILFITARVVFLGDMVLAFTVLIALE